MSGSGRRNRERSPPVLLAVTQDEFHELLMAELTGPRAMDVAARVMVVMTDAIDSTAQNVEDAFAEDESELELSPSQVAALQFMEALQLTEVFGAVLDLQLLAHLDCAHAKNRNQTKKLIAAKSDVREAIRNRLRRSLAPLGIDLSDAYLLDPGEQIAPD